MHTLKVNNKDYILKFNFRALTKLQDKGISLVSDQEFKLKDIVYLLHIGLEKYHPELTEDLVFDLIDDILMEMTLEDLMEKISDALTDSLGKKKPTPNKKQ